MFIYLVLGYGLVYAMWTLYQLSSIHNYSICILADFQSALESYFFEYEE